MALNYERLLKRDLHEGKWKVLYIRNNSMLKTREIMRFISLDSPRQTADCLEALRLYSSAKNFPNKRSWVQDPLTDRVEEFGGKWRVVENRGAKHGEDEGIYQTLREGWATSLTEDEARITSVQGSYQDGTLVLSRYWPNLDPTLTAGLTITLKATASVTDPEIEGEEQSGTFASSGVQGQIMPEDGAGVISQTLTQMTDITSGGTVTGSDALANALAALRYSKIRANTLPQPFNFSSVNNDTEAFVWKNLNPSNESACMTTMNKWLLLSTLGLVTTLYVERRWTVEENGTATFGVVYGRATGRVWSNIAYTGGVMDVTSFDYQSIADSGRNWERRYKVWENVRRADYGTALTDLNSNTDANYHIVKTTPENNKDGTVTMIQVTEHDLTKITNSKSYVTGNGTVYVEHTRNASEGDLNTALGALDGTTNNSASFREHDNDDLYDYSITKRPYTGPGGPSDDTYQVEFEYTNAVFDKYMHWEYATYNWTKATNYLVYGDTEGDQSTNAKGDCPDSSYTKVGGHAGMRTGIQHLSQGMYIVRVVGGKDDTDE